MRRAPRALKVPPDQPANSKSEAARLRATDSRATSSSTSRHLYGDDRLLTVWPEDDRVVIVLVGPHSGTTADLYDKLLGALGIDMPTDEREKPSCCDEEGAPPVYVDAAEAIADAVESRARRARRRR
ncbi:MAG: hypothetical protein ACRDWI_20250 [Jiangellaceae bacterium]